jgi:hypothetical protein
MSIILKALNIIRAAAEAEKTKKMEFSDALILFFVHYFKLQTRPSKTGLIFTREK